MKNNSEPFTWIVKNKMAASWWPDASEIEIYKREGIKVIINCSEFDNRKELSKDFEYFHINIPDFGTPTKSQLDKFLEITNKYGAGSQKSQNGIDFTANIPTEEICTLPHKDKIEGVVTATRPLPVEVVIEDFSLTFSKGRVVKATAKKGEKMLNKLLEIDEGMSRLGEIALVPHSSPISQSGILFYNRLIDENASCYIALGRGIKSCLKNGEKMSDEEFMTVGGNVSLSHIDFMIGSGEMNIDGITEDGTAEPIMRNGEWAFEV